MELKRNALWIRDAQTVSSTSGRHINVKDGLKVSDTIVDGNSFGLSEFNQRRHGW